MSAETPIFRARAPLRISFAGGGTDVPPFCSDEGGCVISATINRYAHGLLLPRDDGRIRVESTDLKLTFEYGAYDQPSYDGHLDLAKAAISRIASQVGETRGIDVSLKSSSPPGSGLGGSSTLVVTLVGLLREFHNVVLTDYQTARLAWEIERVDLELAGGFQDHYAATFGGLNFIEFGADEVRVNPLRVSRDVLLELGENVLLCFTGKPRENHQIILDQTERYKRADDDTLSALRMQKELAVSMRDALLRGRLNVFGDLLHSAWEFKKQTSPKISTPLIDEAYEAARHAGALGGKVSGAGGGGFMIFYCGPGTRHKVVDRLATLGVSEFEFDFEFNGLSTWNFGRSR